MSMTLWRGRRKTMSVCVYDEGHHGGKQLGAVILMVSDTGVRHGGVVTHHDEGGLNSPHVEAPQLVGRRDRHSRCVEIHPE